METVVGLFRNAFCVCADTFPKTHFLHAPNATAAAFYAAGAAVPSGFNLLIAPLQFAAAIFNLRGALNLPGAVIAWRKAAANVDRAAASGKELAICAAADALVAARCTVKFGIMKVLLTPSFATLGSFSMKLVDEAPLQCALLSMQFALVFGLWGMLVELEQRHAKATLAAAAKRSKGPIETLLCLDAAGFFVDASGSKWSIAAGAGKPLAVSLFAGDVSKACAAAEAACARAPAGLGGALGAAAAREKSGVRLDAFYILLNGIAFFGYLVFPATYFGPFPRIDTIEWLGNFAGDFVWTIEPAVILYVAFAASGDKAKSD
ncbi:hypothetical protein M885DRAFT_538599 [Pelagophyceae sp. CCMP2097]|nr:hypothetical protein M885DRAFT_538599 [Pelagophyceae sp. CCMP2097]